MNGFLEIRLRTFTQAAQNQSRYFRRSVLPAMHSKPHDPLAVGETVTAVIIHGDVLHPQGHEALDRLNGRQWLLGSKFLGVLSDNRATVCEKSDDRGQKRVPGLRVRDHSRSILVYEGNEAIGRAQVDA